METTNGVDVYYNWSCNKMIEVILDQPDDFLKIKETLTRIGIPSKKTNSLIQTCHILHKRGKYFVVHFKEMFLLDGKEANLSVSDIERRNLIINLLAEWKMLTIVESNLTNSAAPLSSIKIVPFKEKNDWKFVSKYSIGKKIFK